MRIVSRSLTVIGVLIFSGFYPLVNAAEQYVFEFSGTFDECDIDCANAGLAPLAGTDFSGAVAFPTSESTAVVTTITDAFRGPMGSAGYYEFEPRDAYFTLTTEIPSFDIGVTRTPTIIVHDCQGSFCALTDDFMVVSARTEDYYYGFYLGGWGAPRLDGVAIPDEETFNILVVNASMDIEPLDFSASLPAIYEFPTALDITFSVRPNPVPVPAAIYLLPLALGLLLRIGKPNRMVKLSYRNQLFS